MLHRKVMSCGLSKSKALLLKLGQASACVVALIFLRFFQSTVCSTSANGKSDYLASMHGSLVSVMVSLIAVTAKVGSYVLMKLFV